MGWMAALIASIHSLGLCSFSPALVTAYWIGMYKASDKVLSTLYKILRCSPDSTQCMIGLENGTWRVIGSLWSGVAGSARRT